MTNPGACDILQLVRSGEVSATEAVLGYVARIEEVNPFINAVVTARFDQALAEAGRLDRAFARGERRGCLHGLPITVKECLDVRGMPTTGGVPGRAGKPRSRDAAVVAMLRKAGAIVLGKTNLAQLSWGQETDNPLFGRTSNPWHLARTPGGSSGGEGAIVAAGGSALGVGTDSGGSVRVPAHYCGIHALKPTSGRLPGAGSLDTKVLAFQLVVTSQPGLLARNVRDLELAYRLLAAGGGAPGPGEQPAASAAGGTLAGQRVGYYLDLGSERAAPAVAAAVLKSVRALAGLGAEVVEFTPPSPAEATEIYAGVLALDGGAALRKMLGSGPRSRDVEAALQAISARAPAGSVPVSLAAACALYRGRFMAAFRRAGLTAIVCPPAATQAPLHETGGDAPASSARLYNLLGMPAGVVAVSRPEARMPAALPGPQLAAIPVGDAEDYLPAGVQIVAAEWQEEMVLKIMAALESAVSDYQEDDSRETSTVPLARLKQGALYA